MLYACRHDADVGHLMTLRIVPSDSCPTLIMTNLPIVLIIGAGTWGASTALHLARRGYGSKVTVLDPYEVPSPISAGNDINKIVDYEVLHFTFIANTDRVIERVRASRIFN